MLAPGGDTVPVFSTAMRIDSCSHQAHNHAAAAMHRAACKNASNSALGAILPWQAYARTSLETRCTADNRHATLNAWVLYLLPLEVHPRVWLWKPVVAQRRPAVLQR
jgi:hypothetical protein